MAAGAGLLEHRLAGAHAAEPAAAVLPADGLGLGGGRPRGEKRHSAEAEDRSLDGCPQMRHGPLPWMSLHAILPGMAQAFQSAQAAGRLDPAELRCNRAQCPSTTEP